MSSTQISRRYLSLIPKASLIIIVVTGEKTAPLIETDFVKHVFTSVTSSVACARKC